MEIVDEGKKATLSNRVKSIFSVPFITDEAKQIDDTEPINCTNEYTQKSDEKAVNILKKLRPSTAKTSFKTEKGDNIKKLLHIFLILSPLNVVKIRMGDYFLSFLTYLNEPILSDKSAKKLIKAGPATITIPKITNAITPEVISPTACASSVKPDT